jgi:hypothetical protein
VPAPPDFARRINYARETLYFFLNGRYSRISSNDCSIRAAIRDFIAAHPIAAPAISTGRLYETENVRLLRRYFYEALDHRRAYYLYGATPPIHIPFFFEAAILSRIRSPVTSRSN